MVVIKNIVKNGNLISCDYYPEAEHNMGHICVDVSIKEIIEHKPSDFKGQLIFNDKSYAWHARNKLLDICNQNPLPTELTIMWY